MPRKQNLSDLIQEEAQKFTPSADEAAIEVTAQAVTEETAVTPEESQETEANGAKRGVPTKADLEATIKELQISLKKSEQQEKTLQQKIEELQSALSEQKSSVKKLTKELEETKKTALQLAQANSKLIDEHKALVIAQEKEQLEKLEQEKLQLEKLQQEKLQQEKQSYKPVPYRKSTRLPDNRPTQPLQPIETKDDFASNTWLYD
ncbi:hypothetical protein WDZ92_12030 [Nostoc sp. NIES-2111]